ncbi:hypothetical protein C8A03DRAFT_17969, partial [Achaetomium macrosporum]
TSCTISFNIETQTRPVTSCSYTIETSLVTQASMKGITYSPCTIIPGERGQFGPENEFTTWFVVELEQAADCSDSPLSPADGALGNSGGESRCDPRQNRRTPGELRGHGGFAPASQ